MRKTKMYFTIALLIMPLLPAIAQPGMGQGPGQGRRLDTRMQAIEARRIAHITNEVTLTPAEAKAFWPVYNEYLSKVEALHEENRKLHLKMSSIDKLSDQEAAELGETEIRRIEEAAILKRTYHEKYKEILPPKKIARLYDAERSFNRMLFRQTQERMGR